MDADQTEDAKLNKTQQNLILKHNHSKKVLLKFNKLNYPQKHKTI